MQGATYLKTLALVAALAVIGCKSATTDVTNIPGHKLADNGGNGNTGGGNGNTGLGPGGTGGEAGGPGITPNPNPGFTPLGLPGEHEIVRDAFQKIHFTYDSAELRPEDLPHITKVAEYLVQNPQHLLEVEAVLPLEHRLDRTVGDVGIEDHRELFSHRKPERLECCNLH